jgi:acetyl-CoA carboxylase biotin carboxyl carrier protein
MPDDKSPSAIDLLQQICDIMEERDLGEVYLREGQITLRVRRGGEFVPVASSTHAFPTMTKDGAYPAAAYATSGLPRQAGEYIRSPMPGRFYRSPSPEAPPYVEVASIVAEGDTVCLIEAMKIFNPLKADFAYEILEILVEDAAAVEYDQPLFHVKRI